MTSTTYYSPPFDSKAFCKAVLASLIGFTGGLWLALLLPGECEGPRPASVPPAVTVKAVEFSVFKTINPLNESAMLYAIAQVESGGDLKAYNHKPSGAARWGKYQMSIDLIKQWVETQPKPVFLETIGDGEIMTINESNPMWLFFGAEQQDAIALFHLRRLLAAGATTPEEVYRGWNHGASADEVQRVGNLYRDRILHQPTTKTP